MILINGRESASINPQDRGLAYGDGVFETLAMINNTAHNWLLHYKRLKDSCKRLYLPCPHEDDILSDLTILCAQRKKSRFVVKLIVTRGIGQRGYQLPDKINLCRICMSSNWPKFPLSYYTEGIKLAELSLRLSKQKKIGRH